MDRKQGVNMKHLVKVIKPTIIDTEPPEDFFEILEYVHKNKKSNGQELILLRTLFKKHIRLNKEKDDSDIIKKGESLSEL